MAMQKGIRICEDEGCEPVVLSLDEQDGSLSLESLKNRFSNAVGLRYYTDNDTIRGVKLSQGKFYPPMNGWGNTIYYCANLTKSEPVEGNVKLETECDIESDKEHETEVEQNEQHFANTNENSDNLQFHAQGRNRKTIPTARRPHRCDICGNCFTQQSHMLRHRRIHTGEKPFACDQCSERFSRSDKLKLHYDKCHSAPAPMMDSPHKETTLLRDRREKKPKVLDDSYEWSTKSTTSASDIAATSDTGALTKMKPLTVRFKKDAKIDLDNGHDGYYSVVNMAEVEMEEDEPVTITPIPMAGIKKEETAVEQVSVTVNNNNDHKPYKCQICSKDFAKKNQLQRHIRIHTGERPFRCQICMKSFTRIDALKRHTASVGHQKQKEQNDIDGSPETEVFIDAYPDLVPNGMDLDPLVDSNTEEDDSGANPDLDEDEDEVRCGDVASFAQVTYAGLENVTIKPENDDTRLNSRRKGKENYCYQCNHLFTNKFNYNRHMKSHEKEEKSFRCTYCNYVFRRQSHLTRHILIHTGEKPFQCMQCDERFSRSDKLKLHVKRTHIGGYANVPKGPIKIDHS